jgi:hypothetical protein
MAIPKLAYKTITAGDFYESTVHCDGDVPLEDACLMDWELWNEFGVESRRAIYDVLIERREDGAVGFATRAMMSTSRPRRS